MKESRDNVGVVGRLERTERALTQIMDTLADIDSHLQRVEASMRTKEVSSSLQFMQGPLNCVVYVMSGALHGDPINGVLSGLRGTGLKLPSFIVGSDRFETPTTCDSVVHMIRSARPAPHSVVGLRWSLLPIPMREGDTVVIGTRYVECSSETLDRLGERLREAEFSVVEDNGEYGGGPIAYALTRTQTKKQWRVVIEVTVGKKLVNNRQRMIELIKILGDL
ncbi:MAG: hypothetical protein ACTSV3_03210 [Candidatus Thorarchaeota archaeon]|nr:MAG: hypothetical protein DRP09_01815 [Candidatus Thorarchaeota archaeon]